MSPTQVVLRAGKDRTLRREPQTCDGSSVCQDETHAYVRHAGIGSMDEDTHTHVENWEPSYSQHINTIVYENRERLGL